MNTRSEGELFTVDEVEAPLSLFEEPAHEFDPVRQSRSKKGGWSGYADMVTGQKSSSPGPQVTCEEAFTYVVRLGISPPSVGSGGGGDPFAGTVHCLATIITGVEGQWIRRKVSVCLGTSLVVTADSIQIQFHDLTLVTDPSSNADVPYRVTAQIAKGVRGHYEIPPTLIAFTDVIGGAPDVASGVITIAPTQSARYPVPQDDGVVSCEVVNTGAEVTVTAAGGSTALKTWNPVVNLGFIVLPPNTTYIEVTNQSESENAVITLTWGIEG